MHLIFFPQIFFFYHLVYPHELVELIIKCNQYCLIPHARKLYMCARHYMFQNAMRSNVQDLITYVVYKFPEGKPEIETYSMQTLFK